MLGWLAYLDGKGQEAADLFRRADEVRPFTAEINYRWGLSLLLLERWAEAATLRLSSVTAAAASRAA